MHIVIMVFECSKQSSSDYKYARSLLQECFRIEKYKFEKIFAASKCRLYCDGTKRKIDSIIGKYNKPGNCFSLIFFADVDTGDSEDSNRNKEILKFSKQYGNIASVVWSNYDIEDVFLGKRIAHNKPKEAENFLIGKKIKTVNINKLKVSNAISTIHSSNIYLIFDSIFPRQ